MDDWWTSMNREWLSARREARREEVYDRLGKKEKHVSSWLAAYGHIGQFSPLDRQHLHAVTMTTLFRQME